MRLANCRAKEKGNFCVVLQTRADCCFVVLIVMPASTEMCANMIVVHLCTDMCRRLNSVTRTMKKKRGKMALLKSNEEECCDLSDYWGLPTRMALTTTFSRSKRRKI